MSDVADAFYREYAKSGVWFGTFWLGRHVYKCPTDLWRYQEILHDTRPDLIVETGTFSGGSALYLASMCDLRGSGRIITIDIDPQENLPAHPRIKYLTGSSIAPEILAQVREEAAGADRVMVILDSDHTKEHVLAELREYAPLVSDECYLIVEDTNAKLLPGHGPGPDEAIQEFLKENPAFSVDEHSEKFLLTFQPGGYLRRGPGQTLTGLGQRIAAEGLRTSPADPGAAD
jgi:cephalosporin hydroxylase